MIITILVGIVQIFLSLNLILRRRNVVAIVSEILTSLVLLFVLSGFSFDVKSILWMNIGLALGEYVFVKIFLVIFMIISRIFCFYAIKNLYNKKRKITKKKLEIIRKFSKAKYWPRLKLGLPSKAEKRHPVTKVRFDKKGFPKFKSYFTVKLQRKDYRKSREQHFYIANKELYKKILSSSRLRAKFSKKEIEEISQGETPNKYTWHHHQDAGVLELVDYEIHSKTSHIGGYSIWGGK